MSPLRGSLSADGRVEIMITSFRFVDPHAANNSLHRSAGRVLLNLFL